MINKNFSHSSESRTLKPEEKDFLLAIIGEDDPKSIGLGQLDLIFVQELSDGHMGSIRLIQSVCKNTNRQFDRKWKEVQFLIFRNLSCKCFCFQFSGRRRCGNGISNRIESEGYIFNRSVPSATYADTGDHYIG
ncbi:hypothetical protein LEP1GSC073_1330 [Leptospira noguchii str. Cascata]|nr:hypothetical protein LEP1GSC072_2461 [Leptospira noguchii str. Bonito]EMS89173.1 hypothetical protein LEP1GSC073_1330 [Leptospira noguchii str. Cascata]